MSVTVVVKNRMDLLSFGLAVIVSFILGGLSMILSMAKEFKKLAYENISLKRKLKKAQIELDNFNNTLENVSATTLLEFEEANRTA